MKITRENEARAELLRNLGVDDALQRRYIDSATSGAAMQDALSRIEAEITSLTSSQQSILPSHSPSQILPVEELPIMGDVSNSASIMGEEVAHEQKPRVKDDNNYEQVYPIWPVRNVCMLA